jgi:hypothetical protein
VLDDDPLVGLIRAVAFEEWDEDSADYIAAPGMFEFS